MVFCFGDHELDEERFELRREGHAVQPKALELLLHLVRNRARAVPKRELLAAVWPETTVTPGSLARAVSLARSAIGDRARAPHVIATVPRWSYRFEAPVSEPLADATPHALWPRLLHSLGAGRVGADRDRGPAGRRWAAAAKAIRAGTLSA